MLVGGFPIKGVRLRDGRFKSTSTATLGEGGSWKLTVRGTMNGNTIRGALSFHYRNVSSESSSECWSGKGEGDPLIHYVARTAAASRS